MAAMSNFLENKLVDFLFRGQALGITGASAAAGTGPTNLYIGLFTINPSDAVSGVEVAGGSYARVTVASSLVNWAGTHAAGSTDVSSGTNGTTSNNAAISFPVPTANWGVITGFGIFDAPTLGNLVLWGPLTSTKTVNGDDAAPIFPVASLAIQFDN